MDGTGTAQLGGTRLKNGRKPTIEMLPFNIPARRYSVGPTLSWLEGVEANTVALDIRNRKETAEDLQVWCRFLEGTKTLRGL